jgi:DNA-binding NarL/FixJ family response regulator
MLSKRPRTAELNRSLVIAGADSAFRRRLRQSLWAESPPPRIADIASRPDLAHDVAALLPSVILLDLGANPAPNALDAVPALSALAKTIVLANVDDEALAIQALRAGASGFCARNTPTALIRKAVQLVEAGEIWVGRRVMLGLIEELAALRAHDAREGSTADGLTPRERELASLVGRGASNKEIAHHLSISIKTVKTHLTNIFKKLGLSTRVQLALAVGRPSVPETKVG